MADVMLEINQINVYFGVIRALRDVSFYVEKGEVVALIGANGAGKTTTLHTITGLLKPASGSIKLGGVDITKTPAHKIVSMGMAHVPEGRRVFSQLTVEDNLRLGAYTRKDKKEIAASMEEVFTSFPRLKERRSQTAGTLSGGEQQMLAMGRALMSRPSILLMDEPSLGLSPLFVDEIFSISRTRTRRFRSRITPTCWKPVPSPWKGKPRSCSTTSASERRTSARNTGKNGIAPEGAITDGKKTVL